MLGGSLEHLGAKGGGSEQAWSTSEASGGQRGLEHYIEARVVRCMFVCACRRVRACARGWYGDFEIKLS